MATRVRTSAIWVPPLQEQDSSCNRARELQGQESILGQGTDEQRPLTGGLRQRRNTHRTEQVLEWLFISQEQSKPTQSQEKPGKLMIMWNGIRKIKISWKIWQKATNVHLGNHAFLVQIMFLQEKSFISMSHLERDL
uniref:Zinc finger protein 268 n=2 Tax=Canis lupus familiaris TaxID=9615 RepID=A0A8C0PD77_CANLF